MAYPLFHRAKQAKRAVRTRRSCPFKNGDAIRRKKIDGQDSHNGRGNDTDYMSLTVAINRYYKHDRHHHHDRHHDLHNEYDRQMSCT